jgi:GTP-binding protein HflX
VKRIYCCIVDHPEFEDHIASVNQTLMDIKASDKPVIMVLIKLMPIPI